MSRRCFEEKEEMRSIDTDVVVVGAGPGGSMAAKTLAEAGVKVLVLDKRQELGTPKRCAEGVSEHGLKRLNIEPDPRWAVNKVLGIDIYSPMGKKVQILQEKVLIRTADRCLLSYRGASVPWHKGKTHGAYHQEQPDWRDQRNPPGGGVHLYRSYSQHQLLGRHVGHDGSMGVCYHRTQSLTLWRPTGRVRDAGTLSAGDQHPRNLCGR